MPGPFVRCLGIVACVAVLATLLFSQTERFGQTAAVAVAQETPSAELHQLFEEYWEFVLRERPGLATSLGRRDYNDRWRDWSEASRARGRRERERFQEQLTRFSPEDLSDSDRLSLMLLQRDLELTLEGESLDTYLFRVLQLFGFHNEVYGVIDQMPAQTVEDYENIISRIERVPRFVDQHVELLTEGTRRGIRQPARVVRLVLDQINAQIEQTPEQSRLFAAFRSPPDSISSAERNRLREAAEEAYTERFVPAWRELASFFRDQYPPRSGTAISSLEDGRALYEFLVRRHTTTDLTPEEIHQIGLDEVARIDSAMQSIVSVAGFSSVDAFFEDAAMRPEYQLQTREEMLAHARSIVQAVEPELPRLFGRLPRSPLGIRPISEDREASTANNYSGPAADGSRGGFFNLNTARPTAALKPRMESLLLHETVPGHHLQIGLSRELENLPAFRTAYRVTAFTEGWALYAESLGEELGVVYLTPAAQLGRLASERFRAMRLVVDTGLHVMDWTRAQALEYSGIAPSEIDRYIAWPGQALAYKMGELRIKALRARAEQELASNFDVRAFHDVVLRNGALPLDLLAQEVERYIEASR